MAVLALYDMLSEFCHPNADNRTVGIRYGPIDQDDAIVTYSGMREWTPGAIKGARLSMIAVIEAVDIHIDAHNAIFDSAQDLILQVSLAQ